MWSFWKRFGRLLHKPVIEKTSNSGTRLEGWSGELQTSQSGLSYGEEKPVSLGGKSCEDHHECHHMACQDNQGIRPSHYEFRKGRSCLTILISFSDNLNHLWNWMECGKVDEGKAVNVVYPYFSKTFDIISHSIFWDKLASHGLDRCTVQGVKTAWMARSREWWGVKLYPVVATHQRCSLGLSI